MMHWAISHRQLTDPLNSWQAALPSSSSPQFCCWSQCHVVWDILYPDWVSCPHCVPSRQPMHPQLIFTGSTEQEAEKSLMWTLISQQLKYQYVIKIIPILDLKQSTLPAARKKINLMLAETRTHCNGKKVPNKTLPLQMHISLQF